MPDEPAARLRTNKPHQVGPSSMATSEAGWWERARLAFLAERLAAVVPAGGSVLDVGCGSGLVLGSSDSSPGGLRVSIDSYPWPEWEDRSTSLFVLADADHLPFRAGAFDVVGSFDVLEHLADPVAALQEQSRVCRRGGRVVSAVPAFAALWSSHDENVGHLRRYTRSSLRSDASRAGLREHRSTYFFSWLAPPAWLMRNRNQRGGEPLGGDSLRDKLARRLIQAVCAAERVALRWLRAPIGTSLWSEYENG
jgi:SAM-dependent methyltransferase